MSLSSTFTVPQMFVLHSACAQRHAHQIYITLAWYVCELQARHRHRPAAHSTAQCTQPASRTAPAVTCSLGAGDPSLIICYDTVVVQAHEPIVLAGVVRHGAAMAPAMTPLQTVSSAVRVQTHGRITDRNSLWRSARHHLRHSSSYQRFWGHRRVPPPPLHWQASQA
jgi:hypothetical protein